MNLFSKKKSGETGCYIHIGLHKTASSSIQRIFAQHRGVLARKHKIFYVPFGTNHGVPLYNLFKPNPKAAEAEFNSRKKNSGEELTKFLANKKNGKLVFSGEKLSSFKPEVVRRFKRFLDKHAPCQKVIVYVRHPSSWSSSWTQQTLKQGSHKLEEFIENPPIPEYRRRINSYIECFGRENVDIRVFEEAVKSPGGMLGDFLAAIGADPAIAAKLDTKQHNESLCYECVLLLNEVEKARPLYAEGAKEFSEGRCKQDANRLLSGIPGSKFVLPHEALLRAYEKSRPDLEWLTEQLGRNPYPTPPAAEVAVAPVWSAETIRALGLRLFDLHDKCKKLEAKLLCADADAQAQSGNKKKALKLFKKTLRLDPSNPLAGSKLKELRTKKSR